MENRNTAKKGTDTYKIEKLVRNIATLTHNLEDLQNQNRDLQRQNRRLEAKLSAVGRTRKCEVWNVMSQESYSLHNVHSLLLY